MLSNESYTRLLAQFYCKWVALLLSIVLKDALRYELWRGPPQFCGKNGLDYPLPLRRCNQAVSQM